MFFLRHFAIPILFILLVLHRAQAEPIQNQTNTGPGGIIANNSGVGTQNLIFGNLEKNSPFISDNQLKRLLSSIKSDEISKQRKRDPLFVKLERYLVATNPTELEVSTVEFEQWVGDEEPFLTIHIKNTSELPAESVIVGVYAPLKPGQKNSMELSLRKSKSLKDVEIGLKSTLFISQGSEIQLPIGAFSELLARIDLGINKDYEFLGVGMSYEPPKAIQDSFNQKAIKTDANGFIGAATSFTNKPLGIFLTYRTIFDQVVVKPFLVHFYFGRNLNPQ